MKPGNYPLRSSQSRAAARSLLAARNADGEELHFQIVSVVDGMQVDLETLARRPEAAPARIAKHEAE